MNMRTLVGLFAVREEGLHALARLREAGLEAELIEGAPAAAESSRSASTQRDTSGDSTTTASGATVGALAGGGLGAVPAALIGKLLAHGLTEMHAHQYEQTVAQGGVVVTVHAPELQPAALAEDILRQGNAVHVHTGEHPVT